eukprot:gene4386-4807_t
MRVLSVAEKPSVAKELAAIIGKGHPVNRRAGFSPYNHVFDIQDCLFQDQHVQMSITSVSGHMMDLEFDASFKSWSSCNPVDLFQAPLHKTVKKESVDIQRTIQREARQCQVLLLWLDCDLEGENIAFEVVRVALEGNPRLDVYRARFSALIERDILRTLRHPERPRQSMNDAVDARQEIDLRIGAAFTRFQTMRLRRRFEDIGQSSVISYGPCQFPTLGFVVARQQQIRSFRPQSFWYLALDCWYSDPDHMTETEASGRGKDNNKATLSLHWQRGRVYDRFTALVLLERCLEANHARVLSCQEKPVSKMRPLPLNTIEFQILASRCLRLSSERAMAIAEGLYQRGLLSYPRTETNFFQDGFDLRGLLVEQSTHPQWGEYVQQRLVDEGGGGGWQWPRKGGKDDQAHPPIHPTRCVAPNNLENDDERAVYDLVSRHFLAACSKDAKGSQTTIVTELSPLEQGGDGEIFTASGLVVLERNYLEVYGKYDFWSGSKVPKVAVGDRLAVKGLLLREGRTCPPELLSEADLIAQMDRNGIGTDATIASHISTIQTRGYAVKEGANQRFRATPLGEALVEGYQAMGYQLNRPELRAAIESDCQRVARGEAVKEEVVRRCLQSMKTCFVACQREVSKLDAAMEKHFLLLGNGREDSYDIVDPNHAACGVCHEGMELRQDRMRGDGGGGAEIRRYLFCTTCRKSYPLPSRGELAPHEVSCPICHFQVVAVRRDQSQYYLCPHCLNHPPPPPDGVENLLQDFRCFNCAREDCALASRVASAEVELAACWLCANGRLKLRKSPKGFLVGCSMQACKATWWLPKFIKSAAAEEGKKCERCSIVKLNCVFNLSKSPRGLEPQRLVCPRCDSLWQLADHPSLPLPSSLTTTTTTTASMSMSGGGTVARRAPIAPQIEEVIIVGDGGGDAYSAALAGRRTAKKATTARPNQQQQQRGGLPPLSAAPVAGASRAYPSTSSPSDNSKESEGRVCKCGQEARLLRVTKEGPNTGRPFFSCPQPRGSGCDFFEWADQPQATVAAPAGGSGAAISCNCGQPARSVVTQKEGPNKGRPFYTCAMKRGGVGGCDFFQWADEDRDRSRGGRSTQSGGFGGSGGGGGGGSAGGVICSRCRRPGHYARDCPSKTLPM